MTKVHTPGLTREIMRLAVPAFGALIAEPLFVLADTAIIGHLGRDELAGLGLGATVVQTAVGLMIFLAYSITPAIGRAYGAGQHATSARIGRDGMWFAFGLGSVIALAGIFAARPLLQLMGAKEQVLEFASDYVLYSLPGLIAMLLVLAGTGALRGWQDGKTPLIISVAGFSSNIVLNFVLVYGFDLSVKGSAIGTSLAQIGMATAYLIILNRRHRDYDISWRPNLRGIMSTAHIGGYLFLRTLALRAALVAMMIYATASSPTVIAAHTLVYSIFTFLAFALDALAIAAQSLVSKELGAARESQVRALVNRLSIFGIVAGVLTAVILALSLPVLGYVFTSDAAVIHAAQVGLWILALSQPMCGYVFVLDGILMGAEDARYLALVSVLNVAAFAAVLVFLPNTAGDDAGAVRNLWIAFALVMMGARALTLGLRARGRAWMVMGAR